MSKQKLKTMKIEDYLHLYLGCEVETDEGIGLLLNVSINNYCVIRVNEDRYFDPKDCKPILRPLSDITEEEKIMLCALNMPNGWQPGHIIQTNDDDIAAMRIFNNQGVYKSLYILKKRISPDNFLWLLSHSFDLFGLIDSGLAIDKTKIPPINNAKNI